jgi:hypothetical protein
MSLNYSTFFVRFVPSFHCSFYLHRSGIAVKIFHCSFYLHRSGIAVKIFITRHFIAFLLDIAPKSSHLCPRWFSLPKAPHVSLNVLPVFPAMRQSLSMRRIIINPLIARNHNQWPADRPCELACQRARQSFRTIRYSLV